MTAIRHRIYNPAQLTPEERKAFFAVRTEELETLLGLLRRHAPGEPCQNAVILGGRGMGKSTLGLRFLDIVAEDPALSQLWQPIPFPEESYGVSSLGELWAMALQELAYQVGEPRWAEAADHLLKKERDDTRLEELTYAELMRFREESGKIPLLFVENLNLIFEQFRDKKGNDAHRLRERLSGKDDVFFLGGATHLFGALDDPDEPLFDFFRPIDLHPLDREGCLTLIRAIAAAEGVPGTDDGDGGQNAEAREAFIEDSLGRIEAIRTLTGGSPRLIALSWRLIKESPAGQAREDLEKLIDAQTPYFQSQIEKLAPQARKVFNAVALLWKPATAKEIAEEARLSSSQASAQLGILSDMGYVEKVAVPSTKRDHYQVTDRFYGIYYLIRFSREESKKIEGIIDFLYLAFGSHGIWRMLTVLAANPVEVRSSDFEYVFNAALIKGIETAPEIGAQKLLDGLTDEELHDIIQTIDNDAHFESVKSNKIMLQVDSIIKTISGSIYSEILRKDREKKIYSLYLTAVLFPNVKTNEKIKMVHLLYISKYYDKFKETGFSIILIGFIILSGNNWALSFVERFTDKFDSMIVEGVKKHRAGKSIDFLPTEVQRLIKTFEQVRVTAPSAARAGVGAGR
jgi:hypothetical protein